MPLLIETLTTCKVCGNTVEDTVIEGVCSQCFEEHCTTCEGCGVLLTTHPHVPGAYYHPESRTRCYDCFDNRRATYWSRGRFSVPHAHYDEIQSTRNFGVEVETSRCADYPLLSGHTSFGCKTDYSISGREFDSPILYGDEGLASIRSLLMFGKAHKWEANRRCGCHIHLDLRDETYDEKCRIAYGYRKFLDIWGSFIPRYRRNTTYSGPPCYTSAELRTVCEECSYFNEVVYDFEGDRYYMVNLESYLDYKTIEVRMLEGTVDPETICNWIIANCRFIDAIKQFTFDEIDALADVTGRRKTTNFYNLIGHADAVQWLKRRRGRYGKFKIET